MEPFSALLSAREREMSRMAILLWMLSRVVPASLTPERHVHLHAACLAGRATCALGAAGARVCLLSWIGLTKETAKGVWHGLWAAKIIRKDQACSLACFRSVGSVCLPVLVACVCCSRTFVIVAVCTSHYRAFASSIPTCTLGYLTLHVSRITWAECLCILVT